MISSMKKTVRTAGYRGLFDGISGTWLRQMTYSLCRFWAYDESKKILQVGVSDGKGGKRDEAWRLALAGSMAGGIAGLIGNPAGVSFNFAFARERNTDLHVHPMTFKSEIVMVCCHTHSSGNKI